MTTCSSPPRTTSHQTGRRSTAVLLVLGVVLSSFSLRTAVTSLTPLLDQVGDDLGFGATMAGLLGMVPTAMFALFGILTPRLVHRLGLEHVALLSMTLATLGLLTRSLSGSAPALLLTSACALAGMGIGNVVIPPVIKRFFPGHIPTLSTVYITVLQLGTLVPPLTAVPLAQAHGWRVSLGVWAIASAVALAPWLVVIRRHRGADPHAIDDDGHGPGKPWRSPVGWAMALMFGMTSLNTYAMFTWIPAIVTEAGHDATYGGVMVALFSGMGLVSAFVAPQLAGRMTDPFPVVAAAVSAFVVGYAGLLWSPNTMTTLWVVLVGLGPTTFPLALTLVNLRSRTHAGSAALSGFAQGVGYTLACAGPMVFGVLHEGTRGWTAPFSFLGLTLVVLLVAGRHACRPRMLEDSWR